MWREPIEDDLRLSVSEQELGAYAEAATGAPGEENTAGMLARGANFVRGYIRANAAVRMGPAGTIPDSLIAPLMDYLCVDVIKRLPVGVSDERKESRRQAISTFKDVADGKFAVADFEGDDAANGGSNASLVSSAPSRFTPENLAGL